MTKKIINVILYDDAKCCLNDKTLQQALYEIQKLILEYGPSL